MKIRHILVPIDFDEGSAPQLEYASQMAQRLGAKITALHIWRVPVYGFPVGVTMPAVELGRAIESSATRALDSLLKPHRDQGIEIDALLRSGTPWEQILEVAKEVDAELIVLATHGRKGLPRALIGSVAEKVIRMSEVPVLTLRIEANEK